ncbi:MAG: hypothetical protein OEV33_00050, partial [Armatimonadota bacterium]|nr:hypothetical protein [Armatimonadota bacterium]
MPEWKPKSAVLVTDDDLDWLPQGAELVEEDWLPKGAEPVAEETPEPVQPMGPRPVAGPDFPMTGLAGVMQTDPRVRLYRPRGPSRFAQGTRRAWQVGKENVALDFLWDDVRAGKIPEEEALRLEREFEQRLRENPVEARNWAEGLWQQTVQILPAMAGGAAQGAKAGLISAAGAGAVGAAIPLPEELATIPGAYGAGQIWGSMHYWAKQGRGEIYRAARKGGVSHKTADIAASIVGPLYAAVEFLQIGRLVPKLTKKGLVKIATDYAKDVALEVGEEGIQKVLTEGATTVAKRADGIIDNADLAPELKEDLKAGLREMGHALGPMALLRIPKAGTQAIAPRAAEAPGVEGFRPRATEREVEPGRRIPYEPERPRPSVPRIFAELGEELGLADLPPAHRPLEKLEAAERIAKAGGRTALVNEHIRLFRQYEQMEPGPEQREVAEQIYDIVRLINRADRVTDPAEGRGFVPPEMEAYREIKAGEAAQEQQRERAEAERRQQAWQERERAAHLRESAAPKTMGEIAAEATEGLPPAEEVPPAAEETGRIESEESQKKVMEPPAPAAETTQQSIEEWAKAEREGVEGAGWDLEVIERTRQRYGATAQWLSEHPWLTVQQIPKKYQDTLRRMAGAGMLQIMWDREGNAYYGTLEAAPAKKLLNADQMTAVEQGREPEAPAPAAEGKEEPAAPAKPAWDFRMWGKGTAARMIDTDGQTVRRIRKNLEGKTVLCENPKHARGIYRHGGIAIKPDGTRWAGEPTVVTAEEKAEEAAYRAAKAKVTKAIRGHPAYRAMAEAAEAEAWTPTGGLHNIYVPKEYAGDVEAYAGEDRRRGLWRYITHDPKGGQHWDDWAAEIGMEDASFDDVMTRLQGMLEAEQGGTGINERALEQALRSGDPELEALSQAASLLDSGHPDADVMGYIEKNLREASEEYYDDLTEGDIQDILHTVRTCLRPLLSLKEKTRGKAKAQVVDRGVQPPPGRE